MTDPTHSPAEIINEAWADGALGNAEDVISTLAHAGYVIVPKEPTQEMKDAGRREMPVEVDYQIDPVSQRITAEMRPLHKCVPPENVYRAMLNPKEAGS